MASNDYAAFIEVLPDFSKFGPAANKGVTSTLGAAGTQGSGLFGRNFLSGVGQVFGGTALLALATGAGRVIGNAIGEAINYSLEAVDLASGLGETRAAVGEVFGDAAVEIEAYASTANKALGQTRQSVLTASQTFGVFAQSAGLTGKPLSDFSTGLVGLSTDLASFFNTSPEEAIQAIGAGLRGEAEPLRRFGVLLDDAALKQRALTLGIYDGTGSLTQQQRVLAAQAEIYAQTSIAQGDFARTSGGLANQQRILEASLTDAQTALGEALLPSMNAAVSFANDELIPKFLDVIDVVGPKIQEALEKSGPKFEEIATKAGPLIDKLIDAGVDGIPKFVDAFDQIVTAAPDWIDAFEQVDQAVYDFDTEFRNLQDDLQNARIERITWFEELLGSFATPEQQAALTAAKLEALNVGQSISDNTTAGVKYGAGATQAAAIKMAQDAVAAASANANGSLIGESIADGLVTGLSLRDQQVTAAAEKLAMRTVNAARAKLEVNSPSRVFRRIGESVGEGFAMGIDNGQSFVAASMDALVAIPNVGTPNVSYAASGPARGRATPANVTFVGSDPQEILAMYQQQMNGSLAVNG